MNFKMLQVNVHDSWLDQCMKPMIFLSKTAQKIEIFNNSLGRNLKKSTFQRHITKSKNETTLFASASSEIHGWSHFFYRFR